jgi:hypothetical protein
MMKQFTLFLLLGIFFLSTQAQQNNAGNVDALAKSVSQEMNLTQDQQEQLRVIFQEAGKKVKNILTSLAPNQQKANQVKQVVEEMDNNAKSVIPSEKHAQYDAIAARMRGGVAKPQVNNPSTTGNQQAMDVKEATDALKQTLIAELGVNSEQADKLLLITIDYNAKKKFIQQSYKSDAVGRSNKMKELNMDTNNKVRGILNDQQYKKFLEILLRQN